MSMSMTGEKELAKLLTGLGDKVARRVTRSAVSAAATPVLKAARAKVPERTGLMKKSLTKKVVTAKNRQLVTALVGPRRDVVGTVDGQPYRPSRVAHLVENGHIDTKGNHVPAKPFLRPAADETQTIAMGIMQTKFQEGVIREATK